MFHKLANPTRLLKIADQSFPVLAVLTVVSLGVGLYYALFNSPPDYQQGDAVRLMYVHVPAAWMSMMVYMFMGVMAASSYVFRHPVADMLTHAAAPIGASFTFLALVTGMIWGKPIWGTAWVWDARLTSVLVLFFLYLGYMALVSSFHSPQRGLRAGRILVLVGLINIPIIKFSVTWWNTLHQPASLTRFQKPAIDAAMLTPLLIMGVAYMLFFLTTLILRFKTEWMRQKQRTARLKKMRKAA